MQQLLLTQKTWVPGLGGWQAEWPNGSGSTCLSSFLALFGYFFGIDKSCWSVCLATSEIKAVAAFCDLKTNSRIVLSPMSDTPGDLGANCPIRVFPYYLAPI